MKARRVAVGLVITGLAGGIYGAAQPLIRSAQTATCRANLRQVGNAMTQYMRDYDEKFPLARNWTDALQPYLAGFGPNPKSQAQIETLFRCSTSGSFYVYNRNLPGVSYSQITPKTPWLYEAGAGHANPNQSDSGGLWPATPVHQTKRGQGNNVLFDSNQVVPLMTRKPKFRKFAPSPIARPKRAQTP